ncbi:MAG: hypothetical protein SOZ67_06685, partial [Alloprevotella sp.]|nr:hypothetical protein [Alloprevotella sp.]
TIEQQLNKPCPNLVQTLPKLFLSGKKLLLSGKSFFSRMVRAASLIKNFLIRQRVLSSDAAALSVLIRRCLPARR